MASPYLLVGAFPELLRFLPKPGAWMETFKQFMGFVLMGTVVYLLAVIKPQYVVPTTGLLFQPFVHVLVDRPGLTRVGFHDQVSSLAQGAAVVCVAWIVMFPGLDLGSFRLPGLATVLETRSAPMALRHVARIVGPKTVLRRLFSRLVPELPPVRTYGPADHTGDGSPAAAWSRHSRGRLVARLAGGERHARRIRQPADPRDCHLLGQGSEPSFGLPR